MSLWSRVANVFRGEIEQLKKDRHAARRSQYAGLIGATLIGVTMAFSMNAQAPTE